MRPRPSSAPISQDLPPERVRAMLAEGLCPWCGSGPYKSPLCHTFQAHGMHKREVRDLALVDLSYRFTSPELSARLSAIRKEQDLSALWAGRSRLKSLGVSETRHYSQAGLIVQRAKFQMKWAQLGPEERVRFGQPSKEARARAGRHKHEGSVATRVCEQCGQSFETIRSSSKKFCSIGCVGKFNVIRQTGRHHSDEARAKISAARGGRRHGQCVICGTETVASSNTEAPKTCGAGCLRSLRSQRMLADPISRRSEVRAKISASRRKSARGESQR